MCVNSAHIHKHPRKFEKSPTVSLWWRLWTDNISTWRCLWIRVPVYLECVSPLDYIMNTSTGIPGTCQSTWRCFWIWVPVYMERVSPHDDVCEYEYRYTWNVSVHMTAFMLPLDVCEYEYLYLEGVCPHDGLHAAHWGVEDADQEDDEAGDVHLEPGHLCKGFIFYFREIRYR